MLDQDDYEEKYQKSLDLTWQQWQEQAPKTESEAYAALEKIDQELKASEQQYQEATGEQKWQLGEYREQLHNRYQAIEESFGLENEDE